MTTIPWVLLYWFALWIGGAWAGLTYLGWPDWVLILAPFLSLGFALIWVFYKLKEQQTHEQQKSTTKKDVAS